MNAKRIVKLFRQGRNQVVCIPRAFELPGEHAIMRKEGNRLIIEPAPPKSLLALLATLAPLDEELPPIADKLAGPVGDGVHGRCDAALAGSMPRKTPL